MIETPAEIVLVGYENGSVRLVTDTETTPEPMFCDLCEYRTPKRKLLIQHMTSNHFYPDRECQICGKRLNKMQLRLHMRFHDLKVSRRSFSREQKLKIQFISVRV